MQVYPCIFPGESPLPNVPAYFTDLYTMETKDSNGNILIEGDSVLITKDLKVKGFQKDLKRGTLVKNIRLTSSTSEIEGKVEGSVLVLKTMFVKKK